MSFTQWCPALQAHCPKLTARFATPVLNYMYSGVVWPCSARVEGLLAGGVWTIVGSMIHLIIQNLQCLRLMWSSGLQFSWGLVENTAHCLLIPNTNRPELVIPDTELILLYKKNRMCESVQLENHLSWKSVHWQLPRKVAEKWTGVLIWENNSAPGNTPSVGLSLANHTAIVPRPVL